MNFVVRHAIQQGVRPITAFQMATLNTAERFGVWRDVGSITPGRCADIILEGNLADVNVSLTIAAGEVVAEEGRMVAELPAFEYPDYALSTVKLRNGISEETFEVRAPSENGRIRVRTIRVVENHVETKEEWVELPVEDGLVRLDPEQDVARICGIELHGKTGEDLTGFVVGLGFERPAALATTVAHDSHNLLVMGNSEEMMARAARAVADEGGGGNSGGSHAAAPARRGAHVPRALRGGGEAVQGDRRGARPCRLLPQLRLHDALVAGTRRAPRAPRLGQGARRGGRAGLSSAAAGGRWV